MTQSSLMDGTAATPEHPLRAAAALAVVWLGAAAISLDTSVNVAFPFISSAYGLHITGIAWVVAPFVLPLACLVVIFGRLGDVRAGHRLVFQAGLVISAVAFGLYWLFPAVFSGPLGLLWLLLARALQGIGAAMTLSCSVALATSLYDERRRTSLIGRYSTALSAGNAIGPIVGAYLIDRFDWMAVFSFRAPIMIFAFAVSFALPKKIGVTSRRRLDLKGAALLFVTVGAIVAFVTRKQLEYFSQLSPLAVVLACLAALAIAGFLLYRREMAFAEPIIDPRHFRRLDFSFLMIIGLCVYLAGFGALLWLPYDPSEPLMWRGGMLTISLFGITIGSVLAGVVTRHWRAQSVGFWGAVFVVIGTALVALSDIRYAFIFLFIQNLGVGLFQVVVIDSLSATLPIADRGVAGSLAQLVRMIGLLLGSALLAIIPQMFDISDDAAHFAARVHASFGVSAGGLALLLLFSMVRWRQLWFPGADQR